MKQFNNFDFLLSPFYQKSVRIDWYTISKTVVILACPESDSGCAPMLRRDLPE